MLIKKTIIFFFLLFIVFTTKANCQNNNTQSAMYNVGLGGFFGGVGAMINKSKNEKFGKVFLKGFIQGSVGGYIVYESKKMIYDFSKTENYNYLWKSRVLNSIGTSIIQNSASNIDFWEKWYFNLGFNRLEFHFKNKLKLKYRVSPIALYGTILSISNGGEFDFKKSLYTGTPIFHTKKKFDFEGTTYANSILLRDNTNHKVLAHELIHVYQYEDFIPLNIFVKIKNKKLRYDYKFINKINNILYFDTHSLFLRGAYFIENRINGYERNFFEREAYFYSKTK